jgi:hypothetical protein
LAKASQALDPLLKQIGQTTNPFELQALAEVLGALAAKLSEAQASQALDPLLKQISHTTDYAALARALQALAPKLSGPPQAAQASKAASASLAWAADDKEALEWAQTLVTLSHQAADGNGMLVAAIAYPAAAGSATEVRSRQSAWDIPMLRHRSREQTPSFLAGADIPQCSSPPGLSAAAAVRPKMSLVNQPARL